MESVPSNEAMKLTRLSAAPGRQAFNAVAEGAASCPRLLETAGTASQLIASVRRTIRGAHEARPDGHVRCLGWGQVAKEGSMRTMALSLIVVSIVGAGCGSTSGVTPANPSSANAVTASSTGAPSSSSCGLPTPPSVAQVAVRVESVQPGLASTLRAEPLIGPNASYCSAIGFLDGRVLCPIRPDGAADRAACIAAQLARPGQALVWSRDGHACSGRSAGCASVVGDPLRLQAFERGAYTVCVGTVCAGLAIE